MHALEERIQRLETSCRRWKMLTLVVAGVTVAHFAMRQPLEAQVPPATKVIKTDLLECSSILLTDKHGRYRGDFGVAEVNGKSEVRFGLSGDGGSMSFFTLAGKPEFLIKGDSTLLRLGSNHLSFEQEEPGATKFYQLMGDLGKQLNLESDPKKREEIQLQLNKLLDRYSELVRRVVDLGIDRKGAGKFEVRNLNGDPVVELFSDRGNSGAAILRDANGKPVFTAPPSTR